MTDSSWLLVYGELSEVDILVFGPHPDDLEIRVGGSLLIWMSQGIRVGLADLTRGELGTKGDAETRIAESREAARRMDVAFRVNLALPDGSLRDDDPARETVTRLIRDCKPNWVLTNLEEDQHPDHAAAARLVKAAYFLARLPKYLPNSPAHSPEQLIYYFIHTQFDPTFLVDIAEVFEKKIEVMESYQSQFVDPKVPDGYKYSGLADYFSNVRSLGEAWGVRAGVRAAEAFVSDRPLVVRGIKQWMK